LQPCTWQRPALHRSRRASNSLRWCIGRHGRLAMPVAKPEAWPRSQGAYPQL
jgi:hypothetical protein